MDIAIQKAQQKITFVSRDKEALRAYQMREMALSDFTSGINGARKEGREEGIAIGEQQGIARGIAIGQQQGIAIGQQQVILNLSQSGLSAAEIARLAGLSNEDVEHILQPPTN
jgi:predicted transposase/invertase (TIGR01784 family)